MAKVIITADLHIHNHRSESRRLDDGLKCLNWIYETALERKIKYVIVAGDFLHDRYKLPTMAYSKACQTVAEYKEKHGINTIFLLGNHDMYYEDNWSVHSLMPIREWATVIDKPLSYINDDFAMDFLPYTPKPSAHFPFFEKPNKTLISHLSVSDAILNAKFDVLSVENDASEKEMLSTDAFERWKKVFLGHYHYGQKLSPIVEYIGSPMQLTFGEAEQKKHIGVFDTEKLTTEYVINNISPQFIIIDGDVSVLQKMDVHEAYIEIRSDAKIDSKFDLAKELEYRGARIIEFKPKSMDIVAKANDVIDSVQISLKDKNKLVDSFVDECIEIPDSLDKSALKKIGKEILSVV
jgi:DNA repair exonuclease SbcCD nuclease subunit